MSEASAGSVHTLLRTTTLTYRLPPMLSFSLSFSFSWGGTLV